MSNTKPRLRESLQHTAIWNKHFASNLSRFTRGQNMLHIIKLNQASTDYKSQNVRETWRRTTRRTSFWHKCHVMHYRNVIFGLPWKPKDSWDQWHHRIHAGMEHTASSTDWASVIMFTADTTTVVTLHWRHRMAIQRGLISLWLYKENKLRDWKNVFTLHIPPELHTLMASLF
jgi:hypothetical protein